ncbi:hypothetical protein GEMRC1_004127 [Eukaryota sp. GEM-RC1]
MALESDSQGSSVSLLSTSQVASSHGPSALRTGICMEQLSRFHDDVDITNKRLQSLNIYPISTERRPSSVEDELLSCGRSPDSSKRSFSHQFSYVQRPQNPHPFPPRMVSEAPVHVVRPIASPVSSTCSTPSISPEPSLASMIGSPRSVFNRVDSRNSSRFNTPR